MSFHLYAYLERTSPAAYRQLLRDGILVLPSIKHLRRLRSALTPDLNLSDSTQAYIRARFKKLSKKETTVSLILDEVHSDKSIQLSNGNIYGLHNGAITASILTVMIKSLAGRYEDVICMSPIDTINAEKIEKVWRSCLTVLKDIGFDVRLTVADGLDANAKFYKNISKDIAPKSKILNPASPPDFIALAHDTTHLFKNIYNNLCNYGTFVCPSFTEKDVQYTAKFSHVCELYELELNKPIKLAHKLNHKVLSPSSLEKTNVKLADSFFHESTINALEYYAKNAGHPDFANTA